MWKFVTRGIRDSLERRACRTNVYSQTNDGNESIPPNQDQQNKHDCLARFDKFHKDLKGPCPVTLVKQQWEHIGARDEDTRRNYDAKYSWGEAFGWSGILAIGYVVCQSLFIRRNLFDFESSNVKKWKEKLITDPQLQASQILAHFVLPRPQYLLPTTKALYVNNKQTDTSEDLIDGAANIEQTYGPLTAEEAIKEAVNKFSYVHEIVLGELEFDSGLKAVEEERYQDALQHFISGANMSSVRSMFNLGLCYELGLGTPKDFKKAAKYYKKAAEEGHVDAMYNLGVYLAQGKGGIGVNLDAAKRWFTEAAEKGQLDAIKALQLEESFNKENNNAGHIKKKVASHEKVKSIKKVNSNIISKLVNYKTIFQTSIETQTESDEFSTSSDENFKSPSPTDMFLEMLGVPEQSAIPFISMRDNGL